MNNLENENYFQNKTISVHNQLLKYATVFAVVEKLILKKQLPMCQPNGTNTKCHQKSDTVQSI